MATHCSILAWRIPCTEEPGGLQWMGWQIVWHDCALKALCFIWHYSEPSLCQMQHSHIIFLSRQENPSFESNKTQSVEKTWSQGLRSRLREIWGGKAANLGGGDSAFICITRRHCTQYTKFIIWIYCRFPLNIIFLKNEPSSTNVKRSATTSSPGLTLFLLLILSVLGVSFCSSIRAQAQYGIRPPFLVAAWA